MKYSHYLWDFNGTLFNDVDSGIQTINTLLSRRNLPLVESLDRYHDVFGFPIIDYYRKIGFDLESEAFDDIAHEWISEYLENAKNAHLYDGAAELLALIKRSGAQQLILSATETKMLYRQLKELGILSYFDHILGLDNVHAHSKADVAANWVTKEKPLYAVLIGDTVHDFEVARAAGMDCLLIANGHQSRQMLKKTGARVFANIRELFADGVL